ncbi:MAG: ABC transporter ATP-binding protein [Actinomycetota bacterium]
MIVSATAVAYESQGRELIHDVTLDLPPGELVAVLGPNGAGKSTLLRLLAGELTPTHGTVTYDERPVSTLTVREIAMQCAFLAQNQLDDVAFSVENVVGMGRYVYRRDPSVTPLDDRAAVANSIAAMGLSGLSERPMRSLSGGERQRAALARTLAQDTPLVLLDEPTTALDIGHQEMVMGLIRQLGSQGRSVVAVLHDLNLTAVFDRVLLMSGGTAVAYGDSQSVLTADRLSEVYEYPIDVVDHPLGRGHLVLPEQGPDAT